MNFPTLRFILVILVVVIVLLDHEHLISPPADELHKLQLEIIILYMHEIMTEQRRKRFDSMPCFNI
jgi:hypothetical protein